MTDSVLTVEREENAAGGRYFIRIEPGVEAEMTFRKGAPGVITVDHTFTPRNPAARPPASCAATFSG